MALVQRSTSCNVNGHGTNKRLLEEGKTASGIRIACYSPSHYHTVSQSMACACSPCWHTPTPSPHGRPIQRQTHCSSTQSGGGGRCLGGSMSLIGPWCPPSPPSHTEACVPLRGAYQVPMVGMPQNDPAGAHARAHQSVLGSANPAWTRGVHLDAAGRRHGQQPISGTADPRVVGQAIQGLR